MHSLRELARSLSSHVLLDMIVLILAAIAISIWEVRRLTGGQTGGTHDRLIALTGIVLGAASCILMAARFIGVA